jgi:SpoVK/Ycf46/Vps4 family AAA+-type ATPase
MIRSFSGEYRKRFGRDLPIQWVRLNEVQQKYVGESEKAMTKLIDTAIQTQPSILFADEVDAIGMSRENGEDWRVSQTAHMLQEIDRLNQSGAFVLFFGSTNRMWSVDLAMLRRFDELIPVDMPTEAVRQMIFKVHLSHLSARVRAEDLNYDEIGKISHGLTPGDIEKVVRRSVNILLQENGASEPHRKLTEGDIIKSIREYKKPMHLSEWVRQSLQALRSLGQEDMAEQVEEMYGPYVDMRPLNGTTQGVGSVAWEKIPDTAWEEPRRYNIPLIRTSRRLG